jgi:hypothetical protein
MLPTIRAAAIVLGALVLGACSEREPPATFVPPPAAPAIDATPPVEKPAVLVVDEAKVVPAAADLLGKAEWTAKNCSLDSVDGVTGNISVAKGAPHVFKGFFIDETGGVPGPFSIVLKGARNYEVPVATGASRPDVGAFFKNPSLSLAGYEFSTTLDAVPAGDYTVWMLVRRDARSFFCEAGKTIAIK